MKKLLLFYIVAAAALAGCKDNTICISSGYKIVNRIESDIVIELKFEDKRVMTIRPGDTHVIYNKTQCYEEPIPEVTLAPEVLQAEMKIDGEIVPNEIWMREHWNVDADVENHNSTYTLTVTDELLEIIKNR